MWVLIQALMYRAVPGSSSIEPEEAVPVDDCHRGTALIRVLLPLSLVEALEGVMVSLALRTGTRAERKASRAEDSIRELRIKEKFSDRVACVQVILVRYDRRP